jgi:hypothetical protein
MPLATLTRLEALDDQALLSFDDEQALGALLTSDDAALALRARDVLVRQNLRLVWHVVNSTVRKRAHPGLTRDDLFQTGCEGLYVERVELLPWRKWPLRYMLRVLGMSLFHRISNAELTGSKQPGKGVA